MNPYSNNPRTVTFNTAINAGDKIDVILSSVRPFGQKPSYDENQRKAIETWFFVAKRVILFNLPEDTKNMQRPGLSYVGPNTNPPTIKQMLVSVIGLNDEEVVAIVNSDIMLSQAIGKIPIVALSNSLGRAWACVSSRQTLDKRTGIVSPPSDNGLDFFCSTVRIWRDVEAKIPGVLAIGRPVWDNWVNSFFRGYIDPAKYFDITSWKAIIHTDHDEHFRFTDDTNRLVGEAASTLVGKPGGMPSRVLKLIS